MNRLKRVLLLAILLAAWLATLGAEAPKVAGDVHQAAVQGDLAAVQKMINADQGLLRAGDDKGRTPLHLAAYNGHLALVEWLVRSGAEINRPDTNYQLTPLHLACWKGHLPVVRFLLDNGADLQAREQDNETALYYSAISGNQELAKFLIARGLDLNDRLSKVNNTPLSIAVERNQVPMALALINLGADVNWKQQNNWTLLHSAGWAGSPELLEALVKKGLAVNAKTDFGRTALQNACFHGNLEGARKLLQLGADANAVGSEDWPALYLATKVGNSDIAALLLEAGADVNQIRQADRQTALHTAAILGYGKIVAMLLNKGADIARTDSQNLTALEYARRHGNNRIAELLLSRGAKEGVQAKPIAKLLAKPLALGQAIVFYLNHSGWAVKTQNHLLVFDYWKQGALPDEPSLANGTINPQELKDLAVTVFASHSHSDHYTPEIFNWRKELKNVTYVMGFKPDGQSGYIYLAPRQKKPLPGGLEITTLESNDSGEAFLVKADGVTIFHSGDHANRKQDFSGPFSAEIDFLANQGIKPDIFFAPVSGCGFGDLVAVKKGVYYTINKLSPRAIFPMHAGGNEVNYQKFIEAAKADGITSPFFAPRHSGDWFVVSAEGIKIPYANPKSTAPGATKPDCAKKQGCS